MHKGVENSVAALIGDEAIWNYSTDENYQEITQAEYEAVVYPEGVEEYDKANGDQCSKCYSRNTERIDIIVNDPEAWACQCGYCGQVFEVVTGEYSHGG